jgi:hypothetical protein
MHNENAWLVLNQVLTAFSHVGCYSRANTVVLLWVTDFCEAVKASHISWASFVLLPIEALSPTLDAYLQGCSFYQWIDGDEMFDPMIMLFPYDLWKSVPYSKFVHWVWPPLNPPKLIEAEKLTAALRRLMNPPRCHCGLSAWLTTPSKPGAFIPFYYSGLPDAISYHESKVSLSSFVFCTHNVILATLVFLQRGFPSRDFEEYNYGPKSHWPSEYEFVEF